MKWFLVLMSILSSSLSASASQWTTFDKATETAYYQVRHQRRIENISYIETRLITRGHHISVADIDYEVNCKEGFITGENGRKQKNVDGIWTSAATGRPSSRYIQKLYDFACK